MCVGHSDLSPAHPSVPRTTVTCGLLQPHDCALHALVMFESLRTPTFKEGRQYSRCLVQRAEPLGWIGPGSFPGSDRP